MIATSFKHCTKIFYESKHFYIISTCRTSQHCGWPAGRRSLSDAFTRDHWATGNTITLTGRYEKHEHGQFTQFTTALWGGHLAPQLCDCPWSSWIFGCDLIWQLRATETSCYGNGGEQAASSRAATSRVTLSISTVGHARVSLGMSPIKSAPLRMKIQAII